jgi:RNA polymerase sigma factor (sigma-70 family)
MSTEPTQWIQAEEDFHKWIENPKLYPENPENNLRKSIHIYFRKKYYNLLTPIVSWVFDKLPLDDLLQAEKETPSNIVTKKKVSLRGDYGILYKIKTKDHFAENRRILIGLWKDSKSIIYEFYENEFSKVAFMILTNSGTIEDAKDIFQDALVILMDKFTWGKLDLHDCSLGTYVYSISKNLWYEKLRKQKKLNEFIDIEKYKSVSISVGYYDEEPDLYELVSKAIESLGDPCKELLELYYFENHPWETVASLMGYSSAASARNQKYKCLERIREQINLKQQ